MAVSPSLFWLLLVHAAANLYLVGVIWFGCVSHRRLLRSTWVRTVAWSARGIVACALLVTHR